MLRASEFRNKEVIDLASNEKLGYVSDFEICITSGEVSAIIVPEKSRGFLPGKNGGVRISWGDISGIGDDIILVNLKSNK